METKLPYYMMYPSQDLFGEERLDRRDYEYVRSMYPDLAKIMIPYVEEECDRFEYEESMMYDEYPDKYMLYHLSCKIKEDLQPEMNSQAIRESFLDELVQVMLYQEISRRRCRRHRCRRYF